MTIVDLPNMPPLEDAARHPQGGAMPDKRGKVRPKRGDSVTRSVRELSSTSENMPKCVKKTGGLFWEANYVPVSFVANDWKVTPRRIRSLLAEKRLEGRQLENGYWEVAYPYRYIMGMRGPVLKRQQAPKRGRPKSAELTV